MARDLDPGSSPAAFLGAELRRARVAAGMSQEQFSRSLGFDRTVITKAETGERPPSPEVAAAIDLVTADQAVQQRSRDEAVSAAVPAHVDHQTLHVIGLDKLEEAVAELGEGLFGVVAIRSRRGGCDSGSLQADVGLLLDLFKEPNRSGAAADAVEDFSGFPSRYTHLFEEARHGADVRAELAKSDFANLLTQSVKPRLLAGQHVRLTRAATPGGFPSPHHAAAAATWPKRD